MIKTLAQKAEFESKLLKLEKSVLVETLIDASFRDEVTYSAIERLLSSKKENMASFKKKLKKIKNGKEFITWKYTRGFSNEVRDLLDDIKSGSSTTKEGLELLNLFFLSDGEIIERCDDSSGEIGDIFRIDATELFEEYAKDCTDKKLVSKILLGLILDNGYGLRDCLTNNIDQFLPEEAIRTIVNDLWKKYHFRRGKDDFNSSELLLIEEMAFALKDPSLLEKTLSEGKVKNKDYDNFKMGKIWLKAEDHNKALQYLEKVDKTANRYLRELDEVLNEVYGKVGNVEKVKELAWDKFNSSRSKESFDTIIKLEGKEKREKILSKEVKKILKEKTLSHSSVDFLLDLKLFEEANKYITQRNDELDGGAYYSLPSWAKKFENKRYFLVTALIYRALLDSILSRAYSKAYHHGVSYLKKLELISPKIENWEGTSSHAEYFKNLHEQHKRKTSFWGKYNKSKSDSG